MAVTGPKRYIVRRSKDDRQIIFGRRAKRLGKHPLGEFTAVAGSSLTAVSVVDESLSLASGGNVYAIEDIPFDRFYTRDWDSNRVLSGEDTVISRHVTRDAVLTGLNVIFGESISAAAPTELADYKPALDDNSMTFMSGARIDLTPTVATASREATMIIWDRPTGNAWPNWLTIESDVSGRVTGTAPAWDGVSGDGTTDDYEFCLKAGNPFGQAPTALWTLKIKENTFTTPWTKAIDSDSVKDRMTERFETALSAENLANPVARLSNGDGRGWTVGMVVKDEGDAGYLWTYCNSLYNASTSGSFVLKTSGDDLIWTYGYHNNNYLTFTTDATTGFEMQADNWYGLCWTYDGGTTGPNIEDVEDYYSRFKFYTVDLDSSYTVTQRTTTNAHSLGGYTGPISGNNFHLSIGSRYGNNNCYAAHTAFFGMLDRPLTALSDIQHFITDPMSFKADNTIIDGFGNKIWLMGDGTNDSFPQYLYNQVDTNADEDHMHGNSNFTLEGQQMTADDLVSVTVPSLGG